MPTMDHDPQRDTEDLRVLREALGPASRGPLGAQAMRAAAAQARARHPATGRDEPRPSSGDWIRESVGAGTGSGES